MSHAWRSARFGAPLRETPGLWGDAIVSIRLNQQQRTSLPARSLLAMLAVLLALSALPAGSAAPATRVAAQQSPAGEDEEVIVILEKGADPVAAAREMGVDITHIYRHVFTGFSGTIPAEALAVARSARSVLRIFPDGEVRAEAQTVPTGVRRSGVPHKAGSDRLAIDSPIDADIAILDTGVTRVADLNISGGTSCVKERRNRRKNGRSRPWEDDNGHGTHTAGIAAAIDNNKDVVGVAPGARIWAVKVLDANGGGSFSDVICGLDWVVGKQDSIDVINMSLSGAGSDEDEDCENSPFHQAICNVVDAGIPVVAAAGNQGKDASTRVPASYDQVITVSGFADSDGAPGGKGKRTCSHHEDDTFLSYSNFGPDVDIAAPGDCILSLSHTGGLVRESGTSAAAPHVAGAAAHFIARQVEATGNRPAPEETRQWLLTKASRPQLEDGVTGDPDPETFREPVLWLEVLEGS